MVMFYAEEHQSYVISIRIARDLFLFMSENLPLTLLSYFHLHVFFFLYYRFIHHAAIGSDTAFLIQSQISIRKRKYNSPLRRDMCQNIRRKQIDSETSKEKLRVL